MDKTQLLIVYGQLQSAKVAINAARCRADVQANDDPLAKRIETVETMIREISRDLSKELGL